MTAFADSGRFRRRLKDFQPLVLSQDYELFFHRSGTIENCLIKPTDLLVDFAAETGARITFFIDAGMLCRMESLGREHSELQKNLDRIKRHIESLWHAGHEIGLHVHPHWEDTRWRAGAWDFSDTRYQLREFYEKEVDDILERYARILNELCDGEVATYRAGGFCIEPFSLVGPKLAELGITVDSSVVPGVRIRDEAKGVDFRAAPDRGWWEFESTPAWPQSGGSFLEIPVTPVRLPLWHYWGRAVDRVLGRQPAAVIGDGASRPIGRTEIIRRLSGGGRTSELSTDAPKARQLLKSHRADTKRRIWHVMGHPKLLGKPSLDALKQFISWKGIEVFETVTSMAGAIRAGEFDPPSH